MHVRVRVLRGCSRKGGVVGGAVIEVLVHHCQETLLWKPASRSCSGGEDGPTRPKVRIQAAGWGGGGNLEVEAGDSDPLLTTGTSLQLNLARRTTAESKDSSVLG